ncbi:hypothetical protein QJS04_geneDACA013927 [Acorus gramineus]|uniref:WAT1-related protein n=1 Tax=Acorus gramineus TaxID=55184 RepID=A0AAV9AZC3_ACOGR|nr:hypothetical protein QJS04_geneDACA013927 [Acorus gramineus]
MSFFGTIQTATFAAITEPLYSWKIRWTGSLMPFVILYGGCIMPLLASYALIWCIHKKGPVFAAAFSPLQIIFSFLIETLIQGKQAHLGSIFGAMLVIGGLYLLLLGMTKEKEREVREKGFCLPTSDGSSTSPLLGNEDQNLSGGGC